MSSVKRRIRKAGRYGGKVIMSTFTDITDVRSLEADKLFLEDANTELWRARDAEDREKGSIYCHASMEPIGNHRVLYRAVIRDTGIGMSEEFRQHLFEPFSREQEETESGREGTGLGMSIVKLLDKMGGNIKVESTPGVGSCFTVEIPFEIVDRDIAEIILKDAEAKVTIAVDGQRLRYDVGVFGACL